jgi:pimeloyl-ACP methyl ester carboxylesterase
MSMGALIAQMVAIRHPAKTTSLIPIYGSTGDPDLPGPDPEATKVFFEPVPDKREDYINRLVRDFRFLSGPGFPLDEKWHRDLAARAFDRAFYPQGVTKNLAAILTHPSHKPALASVTAPTLVIHGSDDPIVSVAAGKDIADSIPGAELMIIDGMGHDLPHDGAWIQIIERMIAFLGKI